MFKKWKLTTIKIRVWYSPCKELYSDNGCRCIQLSDVSRGKGHKPCIRKAYGVAHWIADNGCISSAVVYPTNDDNQDIDGEKCTGGQTRRDCISGHVVVSWQFFWSTICTQRESGLYSELPERERCRAWTHTVRRTSL